jgi:hypothetical protein
VAYEAGLEALLVPSAAHLDGLNLVIFPAVLLPESRIDVLDPDQL